MKETLIVMVQQVSKKQFYKAFRFSPAPVFISTVTEGRYLEASDSGLRLLGYTREELIGHTVHELSIWENPDERETILSKYSNQDIIQDKLIRLRTKSGAIRETLWSREIIEFNNESVMLSFLYDVTERKKAEAKLRESEQRWMDIIDFLPDATFVIDVHGKVIAWNRAIEEMTGIAARQLLGKGDYEYALPFYGEKKPLCIDRLLKRTMKNMSVYPAINKQRKDTSITEAWVPCLKGKTRYLWAKASLLYNSQGNVSGAIESIRDITDRKNTEDMIKRRGKELEDLNATLRVLLKQREHDKDEIENSIISNMKTLIMPQLEIVKEIQDKKKSMAHLELLKDSLKNICSPFTHKLYAKYSNLTNNEIRVANLVKEGKTTKIIATLLNTTESAVNMHRYRIRQKLNLTKKHNLQVYLSKHQ